MSDAEVRERIAAGNRYDGIVLGEDMNLRILPSDWPGIHGNHSCDPNVWFVTPLELAARRDIAEGEEVVSDHASYTMAPDWKMDCSCGSDSCRGTVSGNDWRRSDLQARYGGRFAPPIALRIAAMSAND